MRLKHVLTAIILTGTISGSSFLNGCTKKDETSTSGTTAALKTLAEQRGIRFGARYYYEARGITYDQLFETEMSVMTATLFWDAGSRRARGEFDFTELDAIVAWGRARNTELHGHVLVWFDEIADLVKSSSTTDI